MNDERYVKWYKKKCGVVLNDNKNEKMLGCIKW